MLPSSIEASKTNNATPVPEGSASDLGNIEASKLVVPTESKVNLSESGVSSPGEGSKSDETATSSEVKSNSEVNKDNVRKPNNRSTNFIDAFSYDDNTPKYPTSWRCQYFELGDNILARVSYIPGFIYGKKIFDKQGGNIIYDNKLSVESRAEDYPESITKPPVFETHISDIDYNSSTLRSLFKLRPGHAFLGIRYTHAKMDYKKGPISFSRKRLIVGFNGAGDDNTSIITHDSAKDAQISTQTPITAEKTVKLFKSMQSYFSKYTRYRLILRNCNKFVKTMAEEIGLHDLASAHDRVVPFFTAKTLSKNLIKDVDNNDFSDYTFGKTSTFINYSRLLDISDDCKESERINYNLFSKNEEGKKERSEMINEIMGSKRYKYFWKNGSFGSEDFKKNAERAAKKDLSIIDKMMSRKYKVNDLEGKINEIQMEVSKIGFWTDLERKYTSNTAFCDFAYPDLVKMNKLKFETERLPVVRLLKEAIKLAGEKHLYLNSYLLAITNMIIMYYNMDYIWFDIPTEDVKNVFDFENYSDTIEGYHAKLEEKKK